MEEVFRYEKRKCIADVPMCVVFEAEEINREGRVKTFGRMYWCPPNQTRREHVHSHGSLG